MSLSDNVDMGELMIKRAEIAEKIMESIALEKDLGMKLCFAESDYKKAQAQKIAELNLKGYESEFGITKPVAITACETLSHGIEPVSTLRFERDALRVCVRAQESYTWTLKKRQDQLDRDIESIRRSTGI